MKRILFILLLGFTSQLLAGVGGISEDNQMLNMADDSPRVELPFPIYDYTDYTNRKKSRIDLADPSNIKTDIVYNPETDSYEIIQKIGDRYYRYPTSMKREEYLEYQRKKALEEHLSNKIDETNEEENNILQPSVSVKSEAFKNIFGSDEISIRPQGTAELSFGVNVSRYDNPALPEKQRRVATFDFQQQIQLNMVGQIGDKLKLTISQNTQATFNFQNQVKIEYTGYEDEIIQKIEAGNVSLPLNTTLIQGSQSLFGIRTDLKFGRLTAQTILSQQKAQRQEINVAGGAQVQDYEVEVDNYEANKHYFLNYYHREHYDSAMRTMPIVSSGVFITKIEVWVTNRINRVEDTRNFIAFTDLGEGNPSNFQGFPIDNSPTSDLPNNDANSLYAELSGASEIREFSSAVAKLASYAGSPGPFVQSVHYEKVENARQLSEQEFTYNAQLGFVSLRSPLNQDEVLGVAYQYTLNGRTYQVGEFTNDVPVQEGSKSGLILKLLKATVVNPSNKTWDLMMKNVYSIGAYQVSAADFTFDIWYNNPSTSVNINYLPYEGVNDVLLMQQLDLDRLNLNQQLYGDGRFDFVPIVYEGNRATNGGTIDPRTGRVYFTTVEPFGNLLYEKLRAKEMSVTEANRIAFTELYDSTKTAAQQIPSKNRFLIKGSYKSSVSSEISLNALNVPEGSVSVTAGGAKLTEGVDYTVDYNLGRVRILNQGILESQTPIKVQLESNSYYGIQSKSLVGAHFNYEFNKDFNWGATVMNLTEKPLTTKVNIGDEPMSNTVIGTDISYRTDAPFLTKLVDYLPFISTKEKSSITAYGEFAYLIPGTQRAISKEGVSYIDGFEGSQSSIDLRLYGSWRLASVPQGQADLFPESAIKTGTQAGFNRSQLAWYQIDFSTFYQNSSATPDHLKDDEDILLNSQYHQLAQDQLFPNNDVQVGTLNNISVLDLAYYPKERGAYNYDTTAAFIDENGEFNNPEDRWGGIMRALSTTNFETANVQFIQFWMLDPFNDDATDSMTTNLGGGDLYFNLGNISEDVLPDSRKSFESGLPTGPSVGDPKDYDTTAWAAVSNEQVIVNAFDNDGTTRTFQDVGLDGFGDEMERVKFSNFVSWVNSSSLSVDAKAKLLNDPSSDNFNYYRDDIYDANEYNILRRYKYFNGMEGNSATSEFSADKNDEGYPTAGTLTPDIEDLNQDNNLSETESYFQYKVSLKPTDMQVGRNYITNEQIVEVSKETGKTEKWYQFKIPIENPDDIVNGIADFRSIRFMRMFLQGFDHEVVLRFAKLELIRGQWRKYQDALTGPGEEIPGDPNGTEFNLAAVNLEENAGKSPVGYIIPPNIVREQDQGSLNLRQLNEQSLSLEICGLQDGDARAAYKNVQFDVRSYKKLKMFVHGEARGDSSLLKSDQLTTFIRLGTDFDENYYEYEMPVKLTPWGTAANALTAEIIWPIANDMEIVFDSLLNLKMERDRFDISTTSEYVRDLPPNDNGVSTRIKVKGNPNLQGMKVIMIGVRNPSSADDHPWQNVEDGQEKCAEIWVNELRLTDFDQTGGWASTARVNMQLADFANVNLAGNYSTPGWGALESKVSDRQRETQMSFDASSNIELGQFFGNKIKLQIPFYVGYSVSAVDPQYDLLAPDIPLKEYDLETRRERAKISRDITRRKSYNFTNVRRERPSGKKVLPWNIENWSASYSYNELYQRDINTDHDITKTYRGGLVYNYSAKPILVEPFKKVSFLNKSKWFSIIKDFNFYVGPKSVGFNTDLSRMYNERQNRNALDTNFIFKPTYLKNFTWNRNYDLKYDLSKNIKFTFSANNSAIILEPGGAINKDANQGTEDYENYQLYKSSIRSAFEPFDGDSIKFGGYSLNYGQSYDLSYKLPLDKLPLTDWISANAKLRGSYDWRRAPLAVPEIGHTIQNSRNFTINSQFNMVTLYNKIGFFEKINNDGRGGNNRGGRQTANRNQPDKNSKKDDEEKTEDSEEDEDGKKKKKKEREGLHPIVKTTGRLIMSFRNFTFNYSENDGMLLPGYAGETSLFGMDNFSAPSFAFTAGQQNLDLLGRQNNAWGEFDSYAPYAASRGWLVENSGLNIQHTISHTQSINARAAFEPFKDLKINLTVDRKYTENENSYYRYNDTLITDGGIGDWEYQNVVNGGSISYTTITWKTAFQSYDDEDGSKAFQELRAYRTQASKLLGEEYGTTLQDNGYYDGFGENQQDVLINSFLAAYTGRSSGNKLVDLFSTLPLPNWDARYDGLSKMSFLKDRVKNFTLSHAYRSNVSVASFQTNLGAFDFDGLQQRDASMNFISETQMQSVTISEQFSPLIGVNATWTVGKNGLITNFEYKRDRSMALNVSNLQIIEMHGTEYVIGGGYKFSKVKLPIKISGKTPESDLTMRLDLSIRDNVSLSRNIIEDSRQFTSGQKMYSIKAKVDYNIGPNLNIALYFDRVVNKPKLSTAFNTANTRAGISLIFNLAQ